MIPCFQRDWDRRKLEMSLNKVLSEWFPVFKGIETLHPVRKSMRINRQNDSLFSKGLRHWPLPLASLTASVRMVPCFQRDWDNKITINVGINAPVRMIPCFQRDWDYGFPGSCLQFSVRMIPCFQRDWGNTIWISIEFQSNFSNIPC